MTRVDTHIWARRAQLDDPKDAREYRQLLNAYAEDPLGQGASLAEDHLIQVTQDLIAHPSAWAYLAGIGSSACAFATCFCGYSTFRGRPLLNVHDIAVLPGFRGIGIGRTLLHLISTEARQLGCCKLTLEVREDNPAAMGLYRSEGFGASKTTSEERIQYLFMEKTL